MPGPLPRPWDRFELVRELGRGGMGEVWAVRERSTQALLALKILTGVDPDSVYRFKYEFRSLSQISTHPQLVRYHELGQEQGRWWFTMDLIDEAKDLLSFLHGVATTAPTSGTQGPADLRSLPPPPRLGGRLAPPPPPSVLRPLRPIDAERVRSTFAQLAQGIAYLHRYHRLHRDLKPSNVLVTPARGVVVLDFGLVTELDASQRTPAAQGELLGTFDYMAPEQAAGLSLTPACDWYAMGVMLYQALTGGSLPFTGHPRAVLEWKQVYEAPSPAETIAGLPEDLVQLCQQLLKREPGLRPPADEILRTLRAWEGTTAAPVAAPGFGAAGQPLPRQAVFIGRNDQLRALDEALAQVRSEITVVCHLQGASGAGKTTLVERFLRHARARGALVLSGRCFAGESVPYKGVDAVIDALVAEVKALPLERQEELLPAAADALARMFPAFLRIPAVRTRMHEVLTLPSTPDSRRQAYAGLAVLLRRLAFTRTVVLAIDDLQWTDAESTTLLSAVFNAPAPPPVLLLLVYRSEAGERLPLPERQSSPSQSPSLSQAPAAQSAWHAVRELPLETHQRVHRRDLSVSGLSEGESAALASALLGDAYPDGQRIAQWIAQESQGSTLFVHELVRQVLTSQATEATEASGAKQATPATRAGVDLDAAIWQRLQGVPAEQRVILDTLALTGRPVQLQDLQLALGAQELPLRELLLLRDAHVIDLEGSRPDCLVRIAHDRIREVLQRHQDPELAPARHLRLARALELGGCSPHDELTERFLAGGDRPRACHYAILAGREALGQLAFQHAEQRFELARQCADAVEDQVRAAEQLIHYLSDAARFADAYAVAVEAMRALGWPLPRRFRAPPFLFDWAVLAYRLRSRSMDQLLEHRQAIEPRVVLAIRVLNAVMKAAYQVRPELCVWLSIRALNLCVVHGNTPECAVAYLVYGAIFTGGIRRQYARGQAFGQLALGLVERYRTTAQRAEVLFVAGYFATSWQAPCVEAERVWERAYQAGMESGDWFHTGCAAAGIAMSIMARGMQLEAVHVRVRSYKKALQKAQLVEPLAVITAVEQATLNLRGLTRSHDSFSDQLVSEAEYCAGLSAFGSRHFAHWYWILKMQCHYLWGDLPLAMAASARSRTYRADSQGMLQEAEHAFYAALIALAAVRQGVSTRPRADLAMARAQLQRYRGWSVGCAANFLTREQILAGEYARATGQTARGITALTLAIGSAHQYQIKHLHALALRLRAEAKLAHGERAAAQEDRAAAVLSYRQWGADGIAQLLTGAPAAGVLVHATAAS